MSCFRIVRRQREGEVAGAEDHLGEGTGKGLAAGPVHVAAGSLRDNGRRWIWKAGCPMETHKPQWVLL